MSRPAFRLEVAGQDVTAKWTKRLSSIVVVDEAGVRADTCELVFDAAVDDAGELLAPAIDAEIKVWLGYEPRPQYMGRYKVAGWEKEFPLRRLTVRGQSADLTTEIKAQKLRSFHDKTLGAIVRQIAGEHSLDVRVDEDLAARPIAHIDQQTESDLAFLTRLAKRNGATFKLADGKLIFTKKGSLILPSGEQKPSIELRPIDVSTLSVSSGQRGNYKSVVCGYNDPNTGRRVNVTAGAGSPAHRDRRLYGSRSEAQAAAEGALGEFRRSLIDADLEMPGRPELYAEGSLRLASFDADADGGYFVTSVTHEFSNSGFITRARLESAG